MWVPLGTLLSVLFSFLFDFFPLVQPCVSASDADPEAGIAGAGLAASSSFGSEAQLVSPFALPQFHAKTPTKGREKKKIKKMLPVTAAFG